MNADPTQIAADVQRTELDVLSGKTIGAAQRVSSNLGYGFLEKVYENSLALELRWKGLKVEQQEPIAVRYQGVVVGDYLPDLLVEDRLIVEIKASQALEPQHRQQCLNYLRATGVNVCLLLNFGRPRLDVKRFVWHF